VPDSTAADTPPTAPATDELTPFDLHGPGRCWHGPDCRGQWQEKDRHARVQLQRNKP
jgi:hypothetical protein